MIPPGRVTPQVLQKRAEEMAKLFAEFADMVKRVQLPETLIGHPQPNTSQFDRQTWRVAPTERMQRVTEHTAWPSDLDRPNDLAAVREDFEGQLAGVRKRLAEIEGVKEGEIPFSDLVNQLQAVSRGMANAVRRIRALEEDNRLLREAQLATVQDVVKLEESVRRLERPQHGQVEG